MNRLIIKFGIGCSWYLVPSPLLAVDFSRKGAATDYFDTFLEAFDLAKLGEMLFNFYRGLRTEETVFNFLMAAGDSLLAPLLVPLLIMCTAARLLQDLQEPQADVFLGVYALAAVVLALALYRTVMAELTSASNALVGIASPLAYSFENTMANLEEVVEEFNLTRKNKDPIARLVDKSLSLYTEYFWAWGSKWGVMFLHGLLDYLRDTLFAINYVLGIFFLPFFIVKRSRLPGNWLLITAFLFLWGVIEAVMIAVTGQLGVAALRASLEVEGPLPIFSESLFYILIAIVHILVGVGMLSSVWIVKSYLLSPAAISGAASLFSLPALSLGMMASSFGNRGVMSSYSLARSTLGEQRKRGGGGPRQPDLQLPPELRQEAKPKQSASDKSNPPSPAGSATEPAPLTGRRYQSLVNHRGKLERDSLPANVTHIARVGKKHRVKLAAPLRAARQP